MEEKPPPTEEELQNRFRLIPSRFTNKPEIYSLTDDEQGIIAEMRCSFCKHVVPAPLEWACKQGHLVCADCACYVPFCPWEPRGSKDARNMCRKPVIRVELRFYNYVYNKSRFECTYRNVGCHEKPTGTDWQRHVDVCSYNPNPTFTEKEA